jgi:hypothetical protein
MKHRTTLLAALVGCLFAASAHADLLTYTGTTTGGSTFNRPSQGPGDPSDQTTNYSTYTFTVSQTGNYSLTTAGPFDTMGYLYQGPFAPASPAGFIAGNDDLNAGVGSSGVSAFLVTGQTYTYVTTSFLGGQSGAFANAITGPGAITTVAAPTPAAGGPRLVTVAGSTVGAPTYNRATDDVPPALSGAGSAVGFKTVQFTVGSAGTYDFVATGDFDTFLSLYAGAFDPNNALTNFVIDNDDAFNDTDFLTDVSSFGVDLVPGVVYTLVTSAFSDGEAGLFSDAITGPGAISLIGAAAVVPEPDVLALLLGGVAVAGLTARRRRKA